MNLSEMRALLAAENLRLTRSLGQNFLHDGNQLRRIIALAEIQPGDQVLEIGPGLGPLTEHLLTAGARVLAIEKDARLIPLLQRRLANTPGLEVLGADALEWLSDPSPEGGRNRDWTSWKVVSNLPYSVGSPILVELANAPQPPASAVVTLQAEVADRIRAQPGTGEFGVLTLLLARTFATGSSFRIPATCFFPAPDVASACIRLERRATPLSTGKVAEVFIRVVKKVFTQRRKQLRKVLRLDWPEDVLAAAWTALKLPDDIRPEALTPGQFAELASLLAGAARSGE
jgi:16S rRNA (adenine1518-N6/adenine1519-N6)-dimethyltransferase